jgi:hypothetical protein
LPCFFQGARRLNMREHPTVSVGDAADEFAHRLLVYLNPAAHCEQARSLT